MREVYRIHQNYVQDLFSSNQFGFHGAFLARTSGLTFSQVQKEMLPLLKEVRETLLNFEPRQLKSDSSAATNTNSETKKA